MKKVLSVVLIFMVAMGTHVQGKEESAVKSLFELSFFKAALEWDQVAKLLAESQAYRDKVFDNWNTYVTLVNTALINNQKKIRTLNREQHEEFASKLDEAIERKVANGDEQRKRLFDIIQLVGDGAEIGQDPEEASDHILECPLYKAATEANKANTVEAKEVVCLLLSLGGCIGRFDSFPDDVGKMMRSLRGLFGDDIADNFSFSFEVEEELRGNLRITKIVPNFKFAFFDEYPKFLLWDVVGKCRHSLLRFVLSLGVCTEVRNYGVTPLLRVIKWNRLYDAGIKLVIDWLIVHGADVNTSDHRGKTPLSFAVKQGRLDLIDKLIASGADTNKLSQAERDRINALKAKEKAGEEQDLSFEVNASYDVFDDRDKYVKLVNRALESNQKKLVELDNGVKDKLSEKLEEAIARNETDSILHKKRLLEIITLVGSGAYLEMYGEHLWERNWWRKKGVSALHFSLERYKAHNESIQAKEVICLLISLGGALLPSRSQDPISGIYYPDSISSVLGDVYKLAGVMFLERNFTFIGDENIQGVDLNSLGNKFVANKIVPNFRFLFKNTGCRFLLDCCLERRGHWETVLFLLSRGAFADLRYLKYDDCTFLGVVLRKLVQVVDEQRQEKMKRVIDQLIASGADINAVNNKGETPLMIAIKGKLEAGLVDKLITGGVDVGLCDYEGQTPLHLAVQQKNNHIIEKLIEKGADVNVENSMGQTPLYFAVEQGSVAAVNKLIEKGARVNKLPRKFLQKIKEYGIEMPVNSLSEKLDSLKKSLRGLAEKLKNLSTKLSVLKDSLRLIKS